MCLPAYIPLLPSNACSIVGYCAHWRESLADPDTKILRPQQDYRGVWLRHFTPMNQRNQAAPAGIAFTGKPAQSADKPVIKPPGNAYRRRVAGDNWM
jgi:citrate synthase